MSHDKPVIRLLMRLEILFDPAQLLGPELFATQVVRSGALEFAVNHGDMAIAPIERVVRGSVMKDFTKIVGTAFVVPHRRKEDRLPKQFFLDLKEHRPL